MLFVSSKKMVYRTHSHFLLLLNPSLFLPFLSYGYVEGRGGTLSLTTVYFVVTFLFKEFIKAQLFIHVAGIISCV